MLGKIKSLMAGKVASFNGNKDFLEGVCAACALIAYADNNVSNEEANKVIKTIMSNPVLSGAFTGRQIELCADAMFKRAEGGRMGKNGLFTEIEEVLTKDTTGKMAEAVMLASLDVADEGGIDAAEKTILEQIAKRLGLKLSDYAPELAG